MKKESSPTVVVVGSANVDFIMKMDRLPRVGESVTNATFTQAFGGKGANQAVAAARSASGARGGAPVAGRVSFAASVGTDMYAPEMISSWRSSGLDTRFVRQTGDHTGSALIMIGAGGENMISAAPAANDFLTSDHIDALEPILAGAQYVLIQFEIPEATTEHLLVAARRIGVPVIWNVAPMRSLRRDLIGMAPIIVVNETEAAAIAGGDVSDVSSAEAAARAIRDLGAGSVIVTLGEQGSVVLESADAALVPAFPVEAVDTTAAGDTYCGCLVTALSEGLDMAGAVRFASAGAAISVGRLGAQPSVPWREEINAFLADRT